MLIINRMVLIINFVLMIKPCGFTLKQNINLIKHEFKVFTNDSPLSWSRQPAS